MKESDRPLITLALFAYNQEEFIREAVAGLFAQTYSPLQIILSDDCSSDATFPIMVEQAQEYRGSNRVVLNRNTKNLGIGGHINYVMSLAAGDLVVAAAGDDTSLPHRVERIVDKWLQLDKGVVSIHSSVVRIGPRGENLGIYKTPAHRCRLPSELVDNNVIIGASHAWSRRLFSVFGNLNEAVIQEDRAIGFRASLMDGVHFIDEPLVNYRQVGMTTREFRPSNVRDVLFVEAKRNVSRMYFDAVQGLQDLQKIEHAEAKVARERLEKRRYLFYVQLKLAMGTSPIPLLVRNLRKLSFLAIFSALRYLFPGLYWKYYQFKHGGKVLK